MRKFICLLLSLMSLTAFADCPKVDFNRNGIYPEDQDVIDYFNVLAGAECKTCGSLDINGNGVFPEDADTEEFFDLRAGGGECSFDQPVLREGVIQRWISPSGDDQTGDGTRDKPFNTFSRAAQGRKDEAGEWRDGVRRNAHLVVWVLPGEYHQRFDREYGSMLYGGESSERPLIIAADPSCGPTRPIIHSIPGSATIHLRNVSHVRIYGLELRGWINTTLSGITIDYDSHDILISDCKIVGHGSGINIQRDDGTSLSDVTIKRTIITGQRSDHSHSQGAYVSGAENVVFEDCVFYDVGNRDTFCQGIYFVHGNYFRVARRSWFGDPGFAGIQARGGKFDITDCVFDQCGNGLGVGHPMARPPINSVFQGTSGTFARLTVVRPKFPFWGVAMQNIDGASINEVLVIGNANTLSYIINPPNKKGEIKNLVKLIDGVSMSGAGLGADSLVDVQQPQQINVGVAAVIDWQSLINRPRNSWSARRHSTIEWRESLWRDIESGGVAP